MAEPKEIGTVWTLGCDVFIDDALTADVQEIKVNDIVLSANIFTEGLSVEVGSDRVNAMDLDVRISMDGLKTYIIDSQIVPYDDVLKITDFSPEATNEKRYASSANTSKKIIDSVGELKGRVNVAEGDIDALGKRVDDLELKGTGGSGDGFWYLNEQDGKIHTDIGIVVHGDAIFEGDTSSGGDGEDVVVGIQGVRVNGTTHYDEDGDGVVDLGTIKSGIENVNWTDVNGRPTRLSEFDNDVPYVTGEEIQVISDEVQSLASLIASMWSLDDSGNLVTDKQVIIKNSLIVEQDTSSGGEGEDTPSGGISGVKVNGVTYYDDNGDGIVDLGTISGGGGTADLSNYYTKGEADARYLALSGNGMLSFDGAGRPVMLNNQGYAAYNTNGQIEEVMWLDTSNLLQLGGTTSQKVNIYGKLTINYQDAIHSGNIGSQSVASAQSLVASDGTTYVSYNATYGQVIVKGINIGYGGNTIETASGGVLNIQANSTGGTIISPYGGNVLIGTATDSGYKLDVYGTGRFKAASASDNYTALRLTNAWYGGSGKKNTDIVMESAVGYRGGVIRCTIDAAYGEFDSLSFGAGDNGASSYIPYLTISSSGNVTIAKNLVVSGDVASA